MSRDLSIYEQTMHDAVRVAQIALNNVLAGNHWFRAGIAAFEGVPELKSIAYLVHELAVRLGDGIEHALQFAVQVFADVDFAAINDRDNLGTAEVIHVPQALVKGIERDGVRIVAESPIVGDTVLVPHGEMLVFRRTSGDDGPPLGFLSADEPIGVEASGD